MRKVPGRNTSGLGKRQKKPAGDPEQREKHDHRNPLSTEVGPTQLMSKLEIPSVGTVHWPRHTLSPRPVHLGSFLLRESPAQSAVTRDVFISCVLASIRLSSTQKLRSIPGLTGAIRPASSIRASFPRSQVHEQALPSYSMTLSAVLHIRVPLKDRTRAGLYYANIRFVAVTALLYRPAFAAATPASRGEPIH